ncbi:peptidogalycan biosysnthesis protein [Haloactinomyces albus]|nr:peptidogalycan biosysnthesis protein [Haloactinomyces albus]
MPVYEVVRETNRFYDVATQLRDSATVVGSGKRRILGNRRGYESRVLVADSFPRQTCDAAVEALKSHLDGLKPATAMYVPDGDLAAFSRLGMDASPALINARAQLRCTGGSFDDYLSTVSRNRRAQVRKERREFVKADHEMGRERLSACYEEAAPLLGNLQREYGHPTTDDGARSLLAGQARYLDDLSCVHTVRKSGRLVGFALTFSFADWIWVRAVGFDRAGLADAFEYFNLSFYEPLEVCYERRYKGLQLGMESLRAKKLRGATIEPLWMVPHGWSCGSEEQLSQRNAQVAAELTAPLQDAGLSGLDRYLVSAVDVRGTSSELVQAEEERGTPREDDLW